MSRKARRLKIDSQWKSKHDATKSAFPEGAVIADLSQQVPNNSYGAPLLFYVDQPFTCTGCGKSEIWTAFQQQWYYEVAKGSGYPTAVRCRSCRKNHAAVHSGNGDPNPIKHLGTLIKRVQSAIDTAIAETGFAFVSKSMLPIKGSFALDYSRGDLFLTCWYDRPNATLIAEVLDSAANCTQVARVPLNAAHSQSQLLDRISEFADEVLQYLVSLPSAERHLAGGDGTGVVDILRTQVRE